MTIQPDQATLSTATSVDIKRILQMIPHRYPMLMVDRVVDMELDNKATGIKNVSINEPFFQGHFPAEPVMPGVLIVEAMAQVAGVLVLREMGKQKVVLLASIDNAKFRRPVVPGDQLMLDAKVLRHKMNIWKMEGRATVNGVLVAEGVFSAAVVDKGSK